MGIILDSNILIAFERGDLNFDKLLEEKGEEEFFLSVISISELLHGVDRAKNAKKKATRSAFVEAIIERFPIYPISVPIARAHARLLSLIHI